MCRSASPFFAGAPSPAVSGSLLDGSAYFAAAALGQQAASACHGSLLMAQPLSSALESPALAAVEHAADSYFSGSAAGSDGAVAARQNAGTAVSSKHRDSGGPLGERGSFARAVGPRAMFRGDVSSTSVAGSMAQFEVLDLTASLQQAVGPASHRSAPGGSRIDGATAAAEQSAIAIAMDALRRIARGHQAAGLAGADEELALDGSLAAALDDEDLVADDAVAGMEDGEVDDCFTVAAGCVQQQGTAAVRNAMGGGGVGAAVGSTGPQVWSGVGRLDRTHAAFLEDAIPQAMQDEWEATGVRNRQLTHESAQLQGPRRHPHVMMDMASSEVPFDVQQLRSRWERLAGTWASPNKRKMGMRVNK